MRALSALALRRTLPPWLFAGLLALLVLAARSSRAAPLYEPDEHALAGVRALARQNVWSVLFVLAPLLFLQAARLGTPAAGAWLAPTPASRLATALALVLGCALACAAATALAALIGEAGSPQARSAWRRARLAENPAALLMDDALSVRWSVAAPAPDERLRLWTTVAIGSGPAVTARLSARSGSRAAALEARIAGRTALELAPPESQDGTLELTLERIGSGALLVLPPDALEILAPAASERVSALLLGERVLFFLASGCTLAFGLARWLRPVLAAGLVLALALFSWTHAALERLLPGADLPRAWRDLAAGLVPAAMPRSALLGALAVAALGLALQARAPRSRGPA